MARKINKLVVHCSASNQDVDIEDIKRWHIDRGWRTVGYHWVITADGQMQQGRPEYQMGAHVAGHNKNSIGICWVGGYNGEDNRTDAQKLALRALITSLVAKYDISDENILGHRDLSPDVDGDGKVERHEWLKTCPNFDVKEWYFHERG